MVFLEDSTIEKTCCGTRLSYRSTSVGSTIELGTFTYTSTTTDGAIEACEVIMSSCNSFANSAFDGILQYFH